MEEISRPSGVGIPLGTFVESLTGWRTTFLIWSGLSALVFLLVAVLVPALPSENAVSVREVFRLPVDNVALRRVMAIVVLFVLGHFGAYTFIRPFLEGSAGAAPASVMVLLMIYGVGGAAGNFIAGFTVAKHVRGTFLVAGAGLVASLVLLLAAGGRPVGVIAALVLWGLSFGAVQLCQVTMTQSAAPDTFEAAMSLNTLAYNTSIALGAFFGGLLADNLGVPSVFWYGVVLTAASLGLALRTSRTTAAASAGR